MRNVLFISRLELDMYSRLSLNSWPSCFSLLIIGMCCLPCSASSSMLDEGNRLYFRVAEIYYSCFMLTPSCGGIHDMKILWASVNPAGLCSSSCRGSSISILPTSLREVKGGRWPQVEVSCSQQCEKIKVSGLGGLLLCSVQILRSLSSLESCPENNASSCLGKTSQGLKTAVLRNGFAEL